MRVEPTVLCTARCKWQDLLSERERCVLQLAAEGMTSAKIAGRLGIQQSTVEEYLQRARIKLQASNKVHAVAIALQIGLIR